VQAGGRSCGSPSPVKMLSRSLEGDSATCVAIVSSDAPGAREKQKVSTRSRASAAACPTPQYSRMLGSFFCVAILFYQSVSALRYGSNSSLVSARVHM
jgi:hypothetical protein